MPQRTRVMLVAFFIGLAALALAAISVSVRPSVQIEVTETEPLSFSLKPSPNVIQYGYIQFVHPASGEQLWLLHPKGVVPTITYGELPPNCEQELPKDAAAPRPIEKSEPVLFEIEYSYQTVFGVRRHIASWLITNGRIVAGP